MKYVGKPQSHESARLHVTGAAKYVDDLWQNAGPVVHLWPVCSPHAHARVVSIDSGAALGLAGVHLVLTKPDVPGENDTGPAVHDEPLFPDVVCFHQQPVAWVVADTEEQAQQAASAVHVTYEALPAITNIEAAIEAASFHGQVERMQRGDVQSALATAEHRLQGSLWINGQEHFYLETQAALAYVDESGAVMVQSSTQHPTETQEIVARVLGLPKNEVVVQCLRMGGAFGGKETQANAWAAVAALAATRLGRPARVRLTRYLDMVLTGKRHPFLGRFDVGFGADGVLTGLSLQLFSDGGWSTDLSVPILTRAMFHADNCYLLPNVEISGRVCRTHYVSHTAFRGFGGPQGMLMIEEILDRVARACNLPPHLVRRRNFYRPGDTSHYGQLIASADRIEQIWAQLLDSSNFESRLQQITAFNATSPDVKRGLAITPVKFGISFTTAFFNQAGALVLIYKDGSVQLNHGGTEMGQGLHTKMLQIAADALGVPIDTVRLMPTRTDKVPNTSATAASSGSDLNGAAVLQACQTLKERLATVAAARLGCDPSEVVFELGRVFTRAVETQALGSSAPGSSALSFSALVQEAHLQRIPLFATGYYRTPNIHFDRVSGKGKPFHYYAHGAAVSEVSVNRFTGQYSLQAVDILHDVGDSLSPLIDRGQVEGGFIQGVGWLTTEELVWYAQGALSTHGAATYKLPTLGECPPSFRVDLLTRAHEPGVVHGSKAVGEPPLMLAISVREALRAAIAAFGKPGSAVELASPATPEAVYWAIERQRST